MVVLPLPEAPQDQHFAFRHVKTNVLEHTCMAKSLSKTKHTAIFWAQLNGTGVFSGVINCTGRHHVTSIIVNLQFAVAAFEL